MKISFISLFPQYFQKFKEHSIIKNALNNKLVEIETINPRDFAVDNKVDDYIYGGGSGMLLMIEPIVKAIRSIKTEDSYVVLLSPRGEKLKQSRIKELSNKQHIILISGHYEGIDARIKHFIDSEISIGDYVLSGGELPSMVIADSLIRLVPGVIKEESYKNESFETNLLEYDQYTKPLSFEGYEVPEVLISGNHNKIKKFQRQNSINKTIEVELKSRGIKNGN